MKENIIIIGDGNQAIATFSLLNTKKINFVGFFGLKKKKKLILIIKNIKFF